MRDFTGCFRKYAQFHGKFTESLRNLWKIRGPHRRYFEVLCNCELRNLSNSKSYI